MNFEQLLKLANIQFAKPISLKKKKFILNFIKYHYYLLEWKRNKLKLGAIVFEIKETYFNEILIFEEIDIRYIRQDNTDTDELKLENRLKALNWKWDFNNIVAFLIVIGYFIRQFIKFLKQWYLDVFFFLEVDAYMWKNIIPFLIHIIFSKPPFLIVSHILSFNDSIANLLINFITTYDILI